MNCQLKLVTSSVSFNPQVKGRQRRIENILKSLHIPYEIVDISQDIRYRKLAHGDVPALFVGEELIGNFDDFEAAVDEKTLFEFLRLPPEPAYFAPIIVAT